jgi:hypothetical protein
MFKNHEKKHAANISAGISRLGLRAVFLSELTNCLISR